MLTYIYNICIKPLIICLIVLAASYAFAEPPGIGSIDRSQEMILEDEGLRRKVGEQKGIFAETIVLRGDLKLSAQEAEILIAPFRGQWLTKEDINQLLDSFKSAYVNKGIVAGRINTSYEFKKGKVLEITIKDQ